jgi:hypothetical protein
MKLISTACSWWTRMSWRKPVSTSLCGSPRSAATIQPSMAARIAAVTTITTTLNGCCHQGSTSSSVW